MMVKCERKYGADSPTLIFVIIVDTQLGLPFCMCVVGNRLKKFVRIETLVMMIMIRMQRSMMVMMMVRNDDGLHMQEMRRPRFHVF